MTMIVNGREIAFTESPSSEAIELGGHFVGLGRGKGFRYVRDGDTSKTVSKVRKAKVKAFPPANFHPADVSAMHKQFNDPMGRRKSEPVPKIVPSSANKATVSNEKKPAEKMTKAELTDHLMNEHSGGPIIGRPGPKNNTLAKLRAQHTRMHQGSSGNSLVQPGIAHTHASAAAAEKKNDHITAPAKPQRSAAQKSATHAQLLAARKAARASLPPGHPTRVKIEKAVRSSQKANRS